MSQSISSKSNHFRMTAQAQPASGRAGGFLLPALRRFWTTRRETRRLQELSDYHLRDLGIRREQIPHIFRHGWDR
ncbi:MAG TPA: DUF1127 domain-containing protein [Dongiaceae bacterium]|nr:DUF1127 domain-containing protein [Dongiaceae bacterium]